MTAPPLQGRDVRPAIVWLVLSFIWGSTWLFIKLGLEDLQPFTFATVRFLVAILALLPIVVARRPQLPRDRSDWWLMVGTGILLFAVTYGLVFWGEQYISSGLAALLFGTFPLFGMVIAHFHLPTERMTWLKLVGVILGIGGIALVFSNELTVSGTSALWGSIAIVVSAASAAYGDVLIKLRGGHLDASLLTLVQMTAGLIPLMLLGLTLEGDPREFAWTPLAILSILYLAIVGSALAFVLLYWLIKHMDVTRTMLITLVTPLVAVLLGVLLLGESLTWRTAVGGAGIIGGLALVVVQGRAELDKRAALRPHEKHAGRRAQRG
jgi:drug/metabolite transporter (DMT)-like permease